VGNSGGERVTASPDARVVVSVPAYGRAWVYATVEAAGAGAGTAVVEIVAGDHRQTLPGRFTRFARPPVSLPAVGVVQGQAVAGSRNVSSGEMEEEEHSHEHERNAWTWTTVAAGDRLRPGAVGARVRRGRDSETRAASCAGSTSADLLPVVTEGTSGRSLGPLTRRVTTGLILPRGGTEGGRTHARVLSAGRAPRRSVPCRRPELRAGDRTLPVQAEPADNATAPVYGQPC